MPRMAFFLFRKPTAIGSTLSMTFLSTSRVFGASFGRIASISRA